MVGFEPTSLQQKRSANALDYWTLQLPQTSTQPSASFYQHKTSDTAEVPAI